MQLFAASLLLVLLPGIQGQGPPKTQTTSADLTTSAPGKFESPSQLAVVPAKGQRRPIKSRRLVGKGPRSKVHAFLQRSAAHSRSAAGRERHERKRSKSIGKRKSHGRPHVQREDPESAEEMDEIYGVPKVVWVILADVLAMAAFLSCIPFVMYLAKRRRPEMVSGEHGGCCACLYPPTEPPKMPGGYGPGGYYTGPDQAAGGENMDGAGIAGYGYNSGVGGVHYDRGGPPPGYDSAGGYSPLGGYNASGGYASAAGYDPAGNYNMGNT